MDVKVYQWWVNGQCFNDGEVSRSKVRMVGLVKTNQLRNLHQYFCLLEAPSSCPVFSEPAPVLGSEPIPNFLAPLLGFCCLAQL